MSGSEEMSDRVSRRTQHEHAFAIPSSEFKAVEAALRKTDAKCCKMTHNVKDVNDRIYFIGSEAELGYFNTKFSITGIQASGSKRCFVFDSSLLETKDESLLTNLNALGYVNLSSIQAMAPTAPSSPIVSATATTDNDPPAHNHTHRTRSSTRRTRSSAEANPSIGAATPPASNYGDEKGDEDLPGWEQSATLPQPLAYAPRASSQDVAALSAKVDELSVTVMNHVEHPKLDVDHIAGCLMRSDNSLKTALDGEFARFRAEQDSTTAILSQILAQFQQQSAQNETLLARIQALEDQAQNLIKEREELKEWHSERAKDERERATFREIRELQLEYRNMNYAFELAKAQIASGQEVPESAEEREISRILARQ